MSGGAEKVRDVAGYLDAIRARYGRANKRGKGRLLDEVCQTLACHRKSAIRLLRRGLTEPTTRRPRGRPRTTNALVDGALRAVWEASGEMGSKRLAPFLPELVESLERHGHLTVPPEVKAALVQLKPTTIDRKLRPHRRQWKRPPFGGGSASPSAIKAQVPLRTFTEWSGVEPGSLQIDLVLHCGDTTAGFYVTTLTAVDVASSWTERVAIWGKTQQAVTGGLHRVRALMPIPIREVHSDNGSEFLNDLLQPYCQKAGIRTTRGRPYKKNDQAYVEQKNWTAVRAVVGYARYSSRVAFKRLGELYELERLYRNFFQPVRKLVGKEREGAKVRKRYDVAQTPYQRLLASGQLAAPQREQLARLHDLLDPVHLQQQIADAQRALFAERELPKTSRAAQLQAPRADAEAAPSVTDEGRTSR